MGLAFHFITLHNFYYQGKNNHYFLKLTCKHLSNQNINNDSDDNMSKKKLLLEYYIQLWILHFKTLDKSQYAQGRQARMESGSRSAEATAGIKSEADKTQETEYIQCVALRTWLLGFQCWHHQGVIQ